jgi:hypothetical protein
VSIASCFEEENELPIEGRLSDLTVYPNPNLGFFTIKSTEPGEYLLLNSVGQIIEMFYVGGNTPQSKDVGGLSPGVYFIKSTSGDLMERVIVVE